VRLTDVAELPGFDAAPPGRGRPRPEYVPAQVLVARVPGLTQGLVLRLRRLYLVPPELAGVVLRALGDEAREPCRTERGGLLLTRMERDRLEAAAGGGPGDSARALALMLASMEWP
jgi:hypothetical protein